MNDLDDLDGLKRYITAGYYSYYLPDHHLANKAGLVYEHMLVAENMLGRSLNYGEVVHHKDMNKKNNKVDNLMVFKTISDHSAYHKGCDIKLDGDVYVSIAKEPKKAICPYCGNKKDFDSKKCLNCYNKERSKNVPDKQTLFEMLLKYNFTQIGKIFNVSDNAVRKWCKKYHLPYKRSDVNLLRNQYC